MSYPNGLLPDAALAKIPGGRLEKETAKAWLAMRYYIARKTKGRVWLTPTGPNSSYRNIRVQQKFWRDHKAGRMPQAVAFPGTSNHGKGIAVDVATPAMAGQIRSHGHKFGFGIAGGRYNSDAPSEWWHTVKVAPGPWTKVWYARWRLAERRNKGRRR